MKYTTTAVKRLVLVLALAAILAPAALAKGGATVHTYAPPPLDAGSAVPNPDYARTHVTAVSRGGGGGFDWRDAGIGAGAAFVAATCVAPLLLVRRAGRKSLART